MTVEQLAIELQKTEDRSIRNEGRIKKLEGESSVLHQLATSVAVLAEQMKTMNGNVTTLTNEVEQIKEKPAKRWDTVATTIITALAAGIVGYIIKSLGL